MRNGVSRNVERLEPRVLLAHFGLDFNFGDTGFAPAGGGTLVSDVSGGKILAVSSSGAARFNDDGTTDPAFTDAGATDERHVVFAIVSGDRLIMVGDLFSLPGGPPRPRTIFARSVNLDDGSVDSSFGDGGIVTIPLVSHQPGNTLGLSYISSAAVTSDGGVVIGVSQTVADVLEDGGIDLLYKLGADGELDAGFGDDGVLTLDVADGPGDPFLQADTDGGFFVKEHHIGWIRDEPLPKITRYHNDGTIDTGFASGGVVMLSERLPSALRLTFPAWSDIVLQPDGRILVEVEDHQDNGTFGYLTRLNADGTLDTSFGSDGVVSFGLTATSGLTLDPQGRILGWAPGGRLFRLTPGGEFDMTFDDDGFLSLPQRPTDEGGFELIFNRGDIDVTAEGDILIGSGSSTSRLIERANVVLAADNRVHIDGTDGADTIDASLNGDEVSVTLNGDTFTFAADAVDGFIIHDSSGDLSADIRIDVDVLLISGAGDDSIRTAGGRDWIIAGDGNDTVDAGGGRKDLVFGGYGDDSLIGGDGADKIFGDSGADVIAGGRGDDWLFGGSPFHPKPEEFEYVDRADTVTGGDGRDRLLGFAGNDVLHGNAGPDVLEGHTGADHLRGQGGRDRLYGNSGSDHLSGGAQGDWLYGQGGNDRLNGDGGNDRLYGDHATGDDTLYGGAGDDLLLARDSVADHLFGGRGADTAVGDDEDDVLAGIETQA